MAMLLLWLIAADDYDYAQMEITLYGGGAWMSYI